MHFLLEVLSVLISTWTPILSFFHHMFLVLAFTIELGLKQKFQDKEQLIFILISQNKFYQKKLSVYCILVNY